jgi:predicted glycosyltransferase involved in capsule biosynthesis
MCSLVTILDLSSRPVQLLNRIKSLALAISGTEFNLTIGYMERATRYDYELKNLLDFSLFKNIKLVSVVAKKDSAVNPSLLRNIAVEAVESEIVLIVDLDIYPDITLFRKLAKKVSNGQNFSIAPCVYLTEQGSCLVQTMKKEDLIEKCLSYSNDIYMHWAVPSSVIALRKDDFLSIGGFFEGYLGHGYEDFDFMIRLAIFHDALSITSELLIDKPYEAPLLSEGFRSHLGLLCIDNLLEGNIAFHLHHARGKRSEYRKQRINNSLIFTQRIKQLIKDSRYLNKCVEQNFVPPLISDFFQKCHIKNIDPSKYYSLFNATPRYLLRTPSKWKRLKNFFAL